MAPSGIQTTDRFETSVLITDALTIQATMDGLFIYKKYTNSLTNILCCSYNFCLTFSKPDKNVFVVYKISPEF